MLEPIRLLLVDGPTICRRSLAAVLNRRRNLQVLADAATGEAAISQLMLHHPDVVLLEPVVPGGGTALIGEMLERCASCRILILTAALDETDAGLAMQAGARGYLHKECEIDELVRAIERVHAGELVVSRGAAGTVLKGLSGELPRERRMAGLTARELEVLQLVVLGRTNPQIAQELCITEHTAKAHLTKILGKLGLDNRVQLTAYALQQGLAAPTDLVEPRRSQSGASFPDRLVLDCPIGQLNISGRSPVPKSAEW